MEQKKIETNIKHIEVIKIFLQFKLEFNIELEKYDFFILTTDYFHKPDETEQASKT